MTEFTIRRRIRATRERVWEEMLALMNGPDGEPEYERLGDPAPHGPGAIKAVNLFGYAMREETLDLEPPSRRRYRMISGVPVDDYVGETTLESRDGETELVWTARTRSSDPAIERDYAEKCEAVLERAVAIIAEQAETA
jgi:hypothetical protein